MFKPLILTAILCLWAFQSSANTAPMRSPQSPQVGLAPVVLIAPTQVRTQSLTISNPSTRAQRFQVEVLAWSQVDGKDRAEPTRDAMATPRIVEVPAGESRNINLVRLKGTGAAYFRLALRQLPDPDQTRNTLALITHHNLSVAFEDTTKTAPQLEAKAVPGGYLLTNRGRSAARLTALGPQGGKPWQTGALGWVLPGQSKFFQAPAQVSVLTVQVLDQALTVQVQ